MLNTIFNVSIIVAVTAMIFANVIMMRYQLKQIRSCIEAQNKLVSAFELMEKAHTVTFEALRATESFLKFVAETSQAHDEMLTRYYTKIDCLERSVENLQDEVEDLQLHVHKIDDLK